MRHAGTVGMRPPDSKPPRELIRGAEVMNSGRYQYQTQPESVNTNEHNENDLDINRNVTKVNHAAAFDQLKTNSPGQQPYYHVNKENRRKIRERFNGRVDYRVDKSLNENKTAVINGNAKQAASGPGARATLELAEAGVAKDIFIAEHTTRTSSYLDIGSSLAHKLKLSDCLIIQHDQDLPVIDILANVSDDLDSSHSVFDDDCSFHSFDDVSVHTLRTVTNTNSDRNTEYGATEQRLLTPMNKTYLHNYQPKEVSNAQAKQYRHSDRSRQRVKYASSPPHKDNVAVVDLSSKISQMDINSSSNVVKPSFYDQLMQPLRSLSPVKQPPKSDTSLRYFGAVEVEAEVVQQEFEYNETRRRKRVQAEAEADKNNRGLLFTGIVKYISQVGNSVRNLSPSKRASNSDK